MGRPWCWCKVWEADILCISRSQNGFLDPRCQRGISEVVQEKIKEINMIMFTKVIFACVKKVIL